MEIQKVKIQEVKLNPNNPRIIKDDKFKKLVKSIQELPQMLEIRPIVVNADMIVLGGNMRLKACKEAGLKEVPIIIADNLTEEQQREFLIKDNVSGGEWDFEMLANEWDVEQLEDWGLDVPSFEAEEQIEDKKVEAVQKLQDKFIVPPFSILNTREGYWQERKKYWNTLIGDNGESREGLQYMGSKITKELHVNNGVSLLDPVLSEIVNKWFGLENCKTFDCFAGDSVFGYVSSYLGNSFTGIELRQEQTDLNNKRIKGFDSKYICDDGRNILNHIEENSQDLLFSCPPYFDLEVYSDLPNDASNQKEYQDFINILDVAFTNAIKCLKDNRFAVITVGDVRSKKRNLHRVVDNVIDIFIKNNCLFLNEIILIEPIGMSAIRCGRNMINRTITKCHQNVLVFYKGNPKEIKNIFPKIEIKQNDEESED